MNAQEKRTTSRCNKLHELPPVVTDGQQTAWCPDCDYYDGGMCNSVSRVGNAACPFDGKLLPLREVPVEPPIDQPRKPLERGLCKVPESLPRSKALEQAIKDRIVIRTNGRIIAVAVELIDRELVVRGTASCYYVKQLALQGVLDVLHGRQEVKVRLNFQVAVCEALP